MGIEVKGLGQLLAALAAALFVRVITGLGPALPPLGLEDAAPPEEVGDEESQAEGGGGVPRPPSVTIRWGRITCALSDKHGATVSHCLLSDFLSSAIC
jgi:hypothetical protein